MQNSRIFLSLLKYGIDIILASYEECHKILRLSMHEWRDVMVLAERQGVLAIAIDGLQA